MTNIHTDKILILDFGAQYTQLIARRIREIGVYCEIWAWDHDPSEIAGFGAKGIILSGGPESTTLPGAPVAPQEVFDSGLPVFGICYGMQTLAAQLGGATEAADQREFGHAEVDVVAADALFAGLTDHAGASRLNVWMSHGDHVSQVPPGFTITATTDRIPVAAMSNEAKRWYGVQFHPEVTHTLQGQTLLRRFVVDVCGCQTLWTAANIIEDQIARVREQVGDDEVILGLSGGVDSSVVAALLHKAIGDKLTCVFVDTGLLRWQEGDQVMAMFAEHMGVKVIRVNAADRYFAKLEGVRDPEAKRKIIGNLFVEIFDEESNKLANAKWLAQGTIYPDVIESAGSKTGKAHVIKSHHNVGGLPEHMKLGLVERCANCSRTKCGAWAWSSACRAPWCIAIRSRALAWACASSAKSSASTPSCWPRPMRSSSTNCARPTCTTPPARRSRCSCRSSRWAWSATRAPTNG